jgi:hypothetical protein
MRANRRREELGLEIHGIIIGILDDTTVHLLEG